MFYMNNKNISSAMIIILLSAGLNQCLASFPFAFLLALAGGV